MSKPNPGQRFRHHSLGPATVIASDDCEVLKKHPDQSQKWRDSFTWFKFDDGSTNGWPTMVSFIPIMTLEDKVEAARQALADAEAELAASKAPNPGDRYHSKRLKSTATVKLIDGEVIYYEFKFDEASNVSYGGRLLKGFLEDYETKLCNCGC